MTTFGQKSAQDNSRHLQKTLFGLTYTMGRHGRLKAADPVVHESPCKTFIEDVSAGLDNPTALPHPLILYIGIHELKDEETQLVVM